MKIIDAHMHIAKHITGIGSEGELYAIGNGMVTYATGRTFRIIPEGLGDTGFSYDTLIDVMNKNNVEKGVLLQGNYLGFQNLYTYEALQKYPDRFVGAATVDPFSAKKDLIIKHLFDDLNFKIIKMEMSNGSGIMANHPRVNLNGKVMNELYTMANEHHLVFVMDIGRPHNVCHQVKALSNAIKKYPDMKFVICHLGSHQRDQEKLLIRNLKLLNLENVYFDIASVSSNVKPEMFPYPTAQKFIRDAIDIVGIDKIMWGSDIPSAVTRDSYAHLRDYVLNSDLYTDLEKQKMFYDNANKVYFQK